VSEYDETYIVLFESMPKAKYWRTEFIKKFEDELLAVDPGRSKVILKDSIWYFLSEHQQFWQGIRGLKLPAEAIYIVLDDPERKRLDSYEGV